MAVDVYQPFTNPVTKETFRCLSHNEEAYITEWIVQPGGYVPFEHVHVTQDEIFHIKQGELRLVLAGREQIGAAGQTVIIPCGVRQIAYNNKPEVLHCILEYRPGLDTYKVFQCFGGLVLDGELDRRGLVNPFKMMYFMKRMNARALARPSYVPGPVFRLLMNMFFMIGSMADWEKQYRRYTE
ncbi:MAG TPA: cupin domain-containing protein [Anaerolineales bacterium]|nr:cupin domain-containing protein [Anaerolineales bacterium]